MTKIASVSNYTAGPKCETRQTAIPTSTLTRASFSDMYRSAVAATVDCDSDGIISAQEYGEQFGIGADGMSLLSRLDTDGDGQVTTTEFAKEIDDPLAADRHEVMDRLRAQIAGGMSSTQPTGRILGADGKVEDPDAMLRFLAARFSGNVDI